MLLLFILGVVASAPLSLLEAAKSDVFVCHEDDEDEDSMNEDEDCEDSSEEMIESETDGDEETEE